jgi:excinuclease ABC subunit B
MSFDLVSKYKPTGDQPQAIAKLVEGIQAGDQLQVLLGVTGSGKTFTMANVIAQLDRPVLVLTHNKTLTAQLYGEFKTFFPHNAVEYFVSYYDYYQPESFIPSTNNYIEKDLQINQEIDKLRLRATSTLLSGRRDIIIVASVSCIYGMGNPEDYQESIIHIKKGAQLGRDWLLRQLNDCLYSRNDAEFARGTFRVRGDTVDINLPYVEFGYRISFFGNEVDSIQTIEVDSGRRIDSLSHAAIYPANLYMTNRERLPTILEEIEAEMKAHVRFFEAEGRLEEAQRIYERTVFDLEMIRELGYCSGIENYSRFFDKRKPGARPFCLLDYFPEDYLLIVDESHVTLPQLRGMWGGDRARKLNLINYGFRLPSAIDNRPLNFTEFEQLMGQTIFVSATPGDYELEQTGGVFVEQVIRPTGLLDPPIEVRPSLNQIDDLMEEIRIRVSQDERVLVTTLTKRMAEELARYFARLDIRVRYVHSDVDAMERVEILRDLQLGGFDVLIGVNLLREGLDLPEVSLVAILDADKEGFLRNARSLTQTAGRAARNSNGLVVFYADKITNSMQLTIDETNRRRAIQTTYNEVYGIEPRTVRKSKADIMASGSILEVRRGPANAYVEPENLSMVADPLTDYMSREQIEKMLLDTERKMKAAAKEEDFITAARYRDEMLALKKKLQAT